MARGGRRDGAGRPKGAVTKATADVKAAAQVYTSEAIETLATIMRDTDAPHAARVSASTAILDRGHGKPKQAVEVDGQMTMNRVSTEPLTEDQWSIQHAPA